MVDVATLVTSVVGAIVGGGGFVAVVQAVSGRRTVQVDAAQRLNEAAMEWATSLKEDARAAREEAAMTRRQAADEHARMQRDADAMHAQMQQVRIQAEAVVGRLRMVCAAIWAPAATVEGLRVMVPRPMAVNGGASDWGFGIDPTPPAP